MAIRGLVNSTTGQGVEGVAEGDSRLSNSRTPTAHAASHAAGQADALTPSAIGAAAGGDLSNHAGATTGAHGGIVASNDSRLSDARTPLGHQYSHHAGQPDALAPENIGAAAANHSHGGVTGSYEFCQGLFYQDGNLWKHAWRLDITNGIITGVVDLGDYLIT